MDLHRTRVYRKRKTLTYNAPKFARRSLNISNSITQKWSRTFVQPPDSFRMGHPISARLLPRQVTARTLQNCRRKLKSTNLHLTARLQIFSDSLSNPSLDPVGRSTGQAAKMKEGSIQQYCGQTAGEAHRVRVHFAEDTSVNEDGQQMLLWTAGELISARRVTAGVRSIQCIGQISDETPQQISRGHGEVSAEMLFGRQFDAADFESQYGAGRNPNAWNLRVNKRWVGAVLAFV